MGLAATPYAQTNVQLYQQLVRAGWPEDELRSVQAAYRLALQVVAGRYHASERPFVAHLVGVASILAQHGADATIVCAGLLHSIYGNGDFGDGLQGLHEARRRVVRRAVGAASEELIAHYASVRWNEAAFKDLTIRAKSLRPVEGAVAWIKLADVLETGFEQASGEMTPQNPEQIYALACELAHTLGHVSIATELQEQDTETTVGVLPAYLIATQRASFAVAPLSHVMRPVLRFARFFRSVRDSLVTVPMVARRL